MDTSQLLALGDEIAATGVAPHEQALQQLGATVRDRAPATSTVLLDQAAPEIVRQRAFAVAAGVLIHGSERT